MNLSSLKPAQGATHSEKRVGRGTGSGLGGTSARGHKGAHSRSGYSRKRGFEGGQMPLQRRLPKFGFKNFNRVEFKAVNLDTIQALVEQTDAKVITKDLLYKHGLVGKNDLVKVLSRGDLKAALEVQADGFSASAIEAIEKAGGKATKI